MYKKLDKVEKSEIKTIYENIDKLKTNRSEKELKEIMDIVKKSNTSGGAKALTAKEKEEKNEKEELKKIKVVIETDTNIIIKLLGKLSNFKENYNKYKHKFYFNENDFKKHFTQYVFDMRETLNGKFDKTFFDFDDIDDIINENKNYEIKSINYKSLVKELLSEFKKNNITDYALPTQSDTTSDNLLFMNDDSFETNINYNEDKFNELKQYISHNKIKYLDQLTWLDKFWLLDGKHITWRLFKLFSLEESMKNLTSENINEEIKDKYIGYKTIQLDSRINVNILNQLKNLIRFIGHYISNEVKIDIKGKNYNKIFISRYFLC